MAEDDTVLNYTHPSGSPEAPLSEAEGLALEAAEQFGFQNFHEDSWSCTTQQLLAYTRAVERGIYRNFIRASLANIESIDALNDLLLKAERERQKSLADGDAREAVEGGRGIPHPHEHPLPD